MPRPTAVSNSMNADVTSPSTVGVSLVRKSDGSVEASRSPSMSAISSRPSTVLMFQVNATRSRQKLSVANLADHAVDVAHRQRRFEVGEPGVHPLLGRQGGSGFECLSHVTQRTPKLGLCTRVAPGCRPNRGLFRRPLSRPNGQTGELLRVVRAISSISAMSPDRWTPNSPCASTGYPTDVGVDSRESYLNAETTRHTNEKHSPTEGLNQ